MVNNAITVKIIDNDEDLKEVFQIRRDVFMDEQSVTEKEEFDDKDDKCTHYIAKVAGITAGTVRLRQLENNEIKIERICVAKNFRGHGVGRKIMLEILKDIKAKGIKIVHLYGQTHAVGFYQSFGFKPYSDEFMDARIPHRKLKLEL